MLEAKLGEEEGGQDLAREQVRSAIRVLKEHTVDAMVVGWDDSVYRHCPRAHQLAFSPPLCCSASRALKRRSPLSAPTSHPREFCLVSRAVQSP